jgi:hypothetical protein
MQLFLLLPVLVSADGRSAVVDAGVDARALTAALRSLFVESMPTPLYENHDHWGTQKEVTRGLKWKGQGLDVHAERQQSLKNDGVWWRVTVTAPNLANTLAFDIDNVHQTEAGKLNFIARIGLNTDIEYERQRWDAGHRLFSTSIRGRARANLTLRCEAASRFEVKRGLFPELVLRLRVTAANFRYDDLVFEHFAGVGGDAAQVLGDAVRANLQLWSPGLEKRLTERANAAIVKAADTKEVRIGLGRLLSKK